MSGLSVTLAVRSKQLRPERLTAILGVEPDRIVIRGADLEPARHNPPSHGWFLTSQDVESRDVDVPLSTLLQRISRVQTNFKQIEKLDPDVKITFHAHIRGDPEQISMFMPKASIEALATIGASLDVDFFPEP